MISDNIHTRLCPYAQDPATTDEDLILQMQHAVSAETERKRNWGGKLIDALKTEVSTLESEVRELKASKQAGKMHSGSVNQKRATCKSHPAACQACKDKGNAINCSHCFPCGGSNLYARDCRAKEGNKLGNPERLLLRDKH